MHRRAILAGLAAQALTPLAGARAAARLGIAPTVIDLAAGNAYGLLYVSNGGDEPLTAQLRLFAWRNGGGEERYTPSDDIGFSPGQFRAVPGGRQTVRLLRRVAPGPVERAYRLAIDQLPDLGATDTLRMTVRMMAPVFVAPAGPPARIPPTLAWTCEADRASHVATLAAANPGVRRVKLTELTYAAGATPITIAAGLAGYVLAASEWSCRFRLIGQPAAIVIAAQTDDGPIRATVPLAYR